MLKWEPLLVLQLGEHLAPKLEIHYVDGDDGLGDARVAVSGWGMSEVQCAALGAALRSVGPIVERARTRYREARALVAMAKRSRPEEPPR